MRPNHATNLLSLAYLVYCTCNTYRIQTCIIGYFLPAGEISPSQLLEQKKTVFGTARHMSADPSIKMNFRGASRGILLPTPATIVALQAAAAASFQVGWPPRSTTSTSAGPGNGLSFTFKDAQGDDISCLFCPKPDHIHSLTHSLDSRTICHSSLCSATVSIYYVQCCCCCFLHINRSGLNHTSVYIYYVQCILYIHCT